MEKNPLASSDDRFLAATVAQVLSGQEELSGQETAHPWRLPAHFEFFAGIELVLHRAVDDVEDAARARHADGVALFEAVDRGNARLAAGKAA